MVLTPRKQRLRSLPSNRTCARQRIPTTSHWVRNLFLKHLHSLIAFFHRPKHHIVYFRFVKKTKTFHRKLLDAYANIHLAFVLISSNECFITWKFHITNTAEPILYECFFFYILFDSWILIRKHLSSEMVGALMTRSWAFTRQNLLFSARTVTSTNQILSLHAWNLTNILAGFFCVRSFKLLYSDTGVSFLSKSNKKKVFVSWTNYLRNTFEI